MQDEKFEELMESHHIFSDGAFGRWLTDQLGEKVDYYQNRMLQAKTWEEFTEARSNFAVSQRFYNLILNPQQFFK